ncbi:hypothetical protein LSM04_001558 [Trypanosoma melophagium]|uniref:uncharacterized protein n=1 Tax=Trypanosoma melophagium TaxID=715481 RepID=UPI00351A4AC5|nr:hypothetical protein LSM04_001558 [Trypanosoma melophagium]
MNDPVGGMNTDNFFREKVNIDSMNQECDDFGDVFLSFRDIGLDDDDDYNVADENMEGCINVLPVKPTKLDPKALGTLDETLRTNVFDRESHINFLHFCGGQQENRQQQQQQHHQNIPGRTESVESISPLFHPTPHSHDLIGSQLKGKHPLLPLFATSEAEQPLSPCDSESPGATVYSSIASSPLRGRPLDFRAFLTKKQVPASIAKENPIGVFVGQLPSTYSEEDTAALLRAIGADANVPIHVQDVKSHNQSRTCAFVLVNSSALPVLLGYSKRILCDISCVWVVEREQAPHLKDYINSFLRDRLRGVPKAALVLEELTPQYVRNRTSSSKWSKVGGNQQQNTAGRGGPDSVILTGNDESSSSVQPPAMPMGFFLSGWNSKDPSALPFRGGSGIAGSAPFVNPLPGSNMFGLPQGNVFPAPQSPSVMNSAPQVNFYMVAAPSNGFHPIFSGQLDNNTAAAARAGNGLSASSFSVSGNGALINSKSNITNDNNNNNNNNNTNNNMGMGFQSIVPELRCRCGSVPSLLQQHDASSCSMCLAPVGALEAAYVCPNDHTLICIRCGNWRLGMGMSENQHAARGMAPCIIPQSNFNGFPPTTTTAAGGMGMRMGGSNPTVFVHTLPSYQPQQVPQQHLMPQISLQQG